MFNLLKLLPLIVGPGMGYFVFGRTIHAGFVGLGIGAIVLAIYLVFERIPLDVLVFGGLGAGGGVIATKLLEWMVYQLDNSQYFALFQKFSPLLYLFMAYLGCMIAVKKKEEIDLLDKNLVVPGGKNKDVKVIDTSVLIDGRILDVASTGFLSGRIIIPRFVLHELQMVADSADNAKRQRGRRGLDIVKKLQEIDQINVKIYDQDFPQVKEVDSKLIELAKELSGKIATVDYNLNKLAVLQGISVLNVNDLSAAMKSVVLPGDNLPVFLAKEGKEKTQAVGYMDDGTMVVIDEGRSHIGKRVNVNVTSILQTSAGRMIFAKVQSVLDVTTEIKSIPAHHDSSSSAS